MLPFSLNRLYAVLHCSRQSFHQRRTRIKRLEEQQAQLLPILREWRERHPGMSVRLLYDILHPDCMGRDRFEQFCFDQGFQVKLHCNKCKTTRSVLKHPFPNLLENLWLTGVNQVWVSDITYFQIPEQMTYITVLMDLWSRFIVGHQISTNMRTEHTTLPALQKALKSRQPAIGLIVHSDAGGQYYSHKFLELSAYHGIKNSMGRSVYENAHVERIHNTIKNQYLQYYHPCTIQKLKELMEEVVNRYNFERPHASLGKQTPARYETLKNLSAKKIIHRTYATKQHLLILK